MQEAKFTVTLKGGGGMDMPWLILKADTEEELSEMLDRVVVGNLTRKIRLADISLKMEWPSE